MKKLNKRQRKMHRKNTQEKWIHYTSVVLLCILGFFFITLFMNSVFQAIEENVCMHSNAEQLQQLHCYEVLR